MRVLMLSWEYPPHSVGGLGTHVAQLAPRLAAQGIEVHVITPGTDNSAPIEVPQRGLTVHRVVGSGAQTPHDIVAASEAGNGSLERAARDWPRRWAVSILCMATIGWLDIVAWR